LSSSPAIPFGMPPAEQSGSPAIPFEVPPTAGLSSSLAIFSDCALSFEAPSVQSASAASRARAGDDSAATSRARGDDSSAASRARGDDSSAASRARGDDSLAASRARGDASARPVVGACADESEPISALMESPSMPPSTDTLDMALVTVLARNSPLQQPMFPPVYHSLSISPRAELPHRPCSALPAAAKAMAMQEPGVLITSPSRGLTRAPASGIFPRSRFRRKGFIQPPGPAYEPSPIAWHTDHDYPWEVKEGNAQHQHILPLLSFPGRLPSTRTMLTDLP
jgi:hypothetical protein